MFKKFSKIELVYFCSVGLLLLQFLGVKLPLIGGLSSLSIVVLILIVTPFVLNARKNRNDTNQTKTNLVNTIMTTTGLTLTLIIVLFLAVFLAVLSGF